MKNYFLTLGLLFCFLGVKAAAFSTGDSIQISLLTCSPGKIAYEKFGHTAIRVLDKSKGLDLIFNYGIFSFDTDNFYYKFMKGETDYVLGVTTTDQFLPEYAARNSSVTEQIINLTKWEKERLLQALLINYEPQNRKYRYNFVYDNCSTRAMDMIMKNVDGVIIFTKENTEIKTFRTHIERYGGWNTWLMFGIDIIFGSTADTYASKMTSMFLPEILMAEFKEAKIVQLKDKDERSLVQEEILLVARKNEEPKTNLLLLISSPFVICTLILIIGLAITIGNIRRKRHNKLFDSILFITTGLIGIIAFYFSFISIHPLVQDNYNLLWLCPLNLIAGIFIWFKSLRTPLFYYLFVYFLMLFVVLIVFSFDWQTANIAFIPLVVLLLTQSLYWIVYRRKDVASIRQLISKKKKRHSRRRKGHKHHRSR